MAMPLQSPVPNLNIGSDGLKIWSCTNCRRRKVRCDRKDPCLQCMRNHAECVFPISGRLPRRTKNCGPTQNVSPKNEELLSRLRSLEAIVTELGCQVENAVACEGSKNREETQGMARSENPFQLHTPSTSSGNLVEQASFAKPSESGSMVQNKNGDIVVGEGFWSIFCNEVERIFEVARGPDLYEFERHNQASNTNDTNSQPQERSHINYYNFLRRQADAADIYDQMFPPPPQMLLMWQTFVDDIDPFLKVLHVPSVTRLIRDLRGQYHSLVPGTEALVFVISLASISITNENDVAQTFNANKGELLSRYRASTEKALEKAELLTTNDIAAVQALVIYIYILQNFGERDAAWSLSGILIRVAVRLNLHKEVPNPPGTTALDIETKRRIWWQICLLESRSASASFSKFLLSNEMFETKMPTNIDDANISSNNSSVPEDQNRRTDSTIFRIQCEIWQLSRELQVFIAIRLKTSDPTPEEAFTLLHTNKSRVGELYLKHLRRDSPLDSFVFTMASLFFTKVELCLLENYSCKTGGMWLHAITETYQGQDWIISQLALVLDYTYSLQNSPAWESWRWHVQDQTPPYHAIALIFKHLCSRKWDATSERGWKSALNSLCTLPEGTPQTLYLQKLFDVVQIRRRTSQPQMPVEAPPQAFPSQNTNQPADQLSGPTTILDFRSAVDNNGDASMHTGESPEISDPPTTAEGVSVEPNIADLDNLDGVISMSEGMWINDIMADCVPWEF